MNIRCAESALATHQRLPRYRKPLATDTRFAHNAPPGLGGVGFAGGDWHGGVVGGLTALGGTGSSGAADCVWAFWFMALIDIAWSIPQLTVLWWTVLGLVAAPESE